MSDKFKVYEGDLSDFKPLQNNHNKHTVKGQKMVTKSMQQRGYARPAFAANDGTVLGGNLSTMEVAPSVGLGDGKVIVIETDGDVPIIHKRRDVAPDSTEAKQLSYEDNLTSYFDFSPSLEVFAADLEAGFDFEAIDVGVADLGQLLGPAAEELLRGGAEKDTEPQVTEVEAERLAKLYGTKPGQVWQLGKHRIACIDSTDQQAIDNLVGEFKFNAMITDPPYGVSYKGGRNPVSNVPREKLKGDDSCKLYGEFLSVWKKYRQDKGVLYLWFASSVGKPVFDAVYENGFSIRALIIWNKIDPHYGNFMAQYMQKHEPCLYCVCKDGTNWYGPTNEVTVWDIKQPSVNEYHPTQKPLECMNRPIRNSTKVGDIVFDPFLGSGTTLVSCEGLKRICIGADISPNFIAVTIQRWVDLTGGVPNLLDTLPNG